jgi:hypothetical protein
VKNLWGKPLQKTQAFLYIRKSHCIFNLCADTSFCFSLDKMGSAYLMEVVLSIELVNF